MSDRMFSQNIFNFWVKFLQRNINERLPSRLLGKRGASLGQLKYQAFPSQSFPQSSSKTSLNRKLQNIFS